MKGELIYVSILLRKLAETKKMKHMFPKRKEKREHERRYTEKLAVKKIIIQRLKNSAIPYKQKLLNKNYLENLRL